MRSKLDDMVLVLNKGWTAIHVTPVRVAIGDVYAGIAKFIDCDMNMHNWESWTQLQVSEDEVGIHGVRGTQIKVPLVMVLTNYNDVKFSQLKLNRRNVFTRDRFECCYCGKKVTMHSGSLDHIIPKSRKGKNSWENLATACKPCNTKKRNLTPEEANLKHPKVSKPQWYALASKITSKSPPFWAKFLDVSKLPNFELALEHV